MEMKIYSVKDDKSGYFRNAVLFPHLSECMRAMTTVVMEPNSELFKYSKDFSLWQTGIFNTITGELSNDLQFVCSINEILMTELQRQKAFMQETALGAPKHLGTSVSQAENAEGSEKLEN